MPTVYVLYVSYVLYVYRTVVRREDPAFGRDPGKAQGAGEDAVGMPAPAILAKGRPVSRRFLVAAAVTVSVAPQPPSLLRFLRSLRLLCLATSSTAAMPLHPPIC